MSKNIFFFIKFIILISLFITNLYAEELTIIPVKKPIKKKNEIQTKIVEKKEEKTKEIPSLLVDKEIDKGDFLTGFKTEEEATKFSNMISDMVGMNRNENKRIK